MKRRVEYLVEKRDGRREWLRATKLARSIHLALLQSGVDEDWRALELATTVLEGLRSRRRATSAPAVLSPAVLSTVELADAVQHVLIATGFPRAAARYADVSATRMRRQRALDRLRSERAALASGFGVSDLGATGGFRDLPSSRSD